MGPKCGTIAVRVLRRTVDTGCGQPMAKGRFGGSRLEMLGHRVISPSGLRALLCLALTSCDSPAGDPHPAPVVTATLRNQFSQVGTVELEQPDTALIARVSGIDLRLDGTIALGDASEGNVKLFDGTGRLLRIVGRKGDGPGEYREPRFPRFGASGRLYVADGANGRVTVLADDGVLTRIVQLEGVSFLMSFELLPDESGFVFTTESPDGQVLFVADTLGAVTGRYLRIRDTFPRGQPAAPMWRSARGFGVAVVGDTAFVTCTLSDSLWSVDLGTGTEAVRLITPPNYTLPVPPVATPRTVVELGAWTRSLQLAVSITGSATGLFVNFVKGVLNAGAPNTVVFRIDDHQWAGAEGAPAILRAVPAGFISLASASDSASGRVVLGRWTRAERVPLP